MIEPERVRNQPAAVILAAGASRRMGSPKPLLPMPGPGEPGPLPHGRGSASGPLLSRDRHGAVKQPETFLDHLIAVLGASCSSVIIVLGHDADAIRAGTRRPALFVLNEHPEEGQLSSLQCGLRAVPEAAGGVLFTPVDHALVSEATVRDLVAAFCLRPERPPVVAPRYHSRHGHPVCCTREIAAELLALPPGAQARDVLHRHRLDAFYLDVDDPAVLLDIDDREAYARALEAARR